MLPKNHKLATIWFVFAALVVVLAIWQMQVILAKDAKAGAVELPPPAKTRHELRPGFTNGGFTGDPHADFAERREAGLTVRQALWIIEDFRNAGLDSDPRRPGMTRLQLLGLRANQQRWYHGALVDGLRLNREQSAAAAGKLAEQFRLVAAEPTIKATDVQINGESLPADSYRGIAEPLDWLTLDPFGQTLSPVWQPQNLCNLDPSQIRILQEGRGDPGLADMDLRQIFPAMTPNDSPPAVPSVEIVDDRIPMHPAQFKLYLLLEPAKAAPLQLLLSGMVR